MTRLARVFVTAALAPRVLRAQTRAPHNQSIQRAKMRADLEFLAGDDPAHHDLSQGFYPLRFSGSGPRRAT